MQHLQISLLIAIFLITSCTTSDRSDQVTEIQELSRVREINHSTASSDIADPEATTLATVRTKRNISMFYRLDLVRDNAWSHVVANVIKANNAKIRACYIKRLNESPNLRGDIAIQFRLPKSTGMMQTISRIGGRLDDRPLFSCITQELSRLSFQPPHNLHGTLVYMFDVKASQISQH